MTHYDQQGRRVLPSADMDDLVLMGLARDSAYAEVAQLKAEKQELALQALAAEGQAVEAYKAQLSAESTASWAEIRANQAINEAKALRARVQELEAALREISTYASSGAAWEPDSCGMCENTLETANAALQKQEGE